MKAQELVKKAVKTVKKYSPEILTSLSCIGVAATAILAAKAGRESSYKIQDDNRDYSDIPAKEKVKLCWKCYVPATVVGTATIACMVSSNFLNRKQQMSLIGAYAVLEEGFRKYRVAANETFGADADKKIAAQIAKDTHVTSNGIVYSDLYDPSNNHDEKLLFYNSMTNQYFHSTMSNVINAEYHVNRNLQLRGNASVLEFAEFLGTDISGTGHEHGDTGWEVDDEHFFEAYWIDFVNEFTTLDDGMECYVIWPSIIPYEICPGD